MSPDFFARFERVFVPKLSVVTAKSSSARAPKMPAADDARYRVPVPSVTVDAAQRHESITPTVAAVLADARTRHVEVLAALQEARTLYGKQQGALDEAIAEDDRDASDVSATAVTVARVRVERSARALEKAETEAHSAATAVAGAEQALRDAQRDDEIAELGEKSRIETLHTQVDNDAAALVDHVAAAVEIIQRMCSHLDASVHASEMRRRLLGSLEDDGLDVMHLLIPILDAAARHHGLFVSRDGLHALRYAAKGWGTPRGALLAAMKVANALVESFQRKDGGLDLDALKRIRNFDIEHRRDVAQFNGGITPGSAWWDRR